MHEAPPEKTKQRVFERITEEIRVRLANGDLKPGSKLPAERELALDLGVSRPAVREALRTLEMSGVLRLEIGPKGGAFVRDGDADMVTRSLGDLVLLGQVSMSSVAEARGIIMDTIVRLAVARATEDEFDQLDRTIDNIEASANIGRRAPEAMVFFRQLAEAARNEVLVIITEAINKIVMQAIDQLGWQVRPELVATRRQMVAGMRRRDAVRAAAAMAEYLDIVHSQLKLGEKQR
jgi:DNA-binding FadR family transcriptional regulator